MLLVNKASPTKDSAVIIESSGRLDSYTIADLQSQLNDAIASQPRLIAVELSKVDFIDSRALAVMVQAMHNCRDAQIDFCLLGPNGAVRRILELTRLDKAINIFLNSEEAIHYFNS